MSERNAFTVASIRPFWRWAVALDDRPDLPAIPYYRKADALAFFDESYAAFPESTTLLLHRCRGRIKVAQEAGPDGR